MGITNNVTVKTFIDFYGERESLEISNLESPMEEIVNEDRILDAINKSIGTIDGYYYLCSNSGKLAIQKSHERMVLAISRFYLDSLQRREDVERDYEKIIQFLEKCVDLGENVPTQDLTDDEALLLGIKKKKLTFSSGRRAFTDDSLNSFRKDSLYR